MQEEQTVREGEGVESAGEASAPAYVELTAEEASALEREIILGDPETTRLPDGRTVTEVRREKLESDREEGREQAARDLETMRAHSSATILPDARVRVQVVGGQLVSVPVEEESTAAEPFRDDTPGIEETRAAGRRLDAEAALPVADAVKAEDTPAPPNGKRRPKPAE